MNPRQSYEDILSYCANRSSPPDAALAAIERMTNLRTIAPQMLAGSHLGLFLEFFATALRPKRILEVGGFTGYAAVCLARGLAPGGKLITLEVNPEHATMIRDAINLAGLTDCIEVLIDDALTVIPAMHETFDLIYLDANKRDYPAYYPLLLEKLAPQGFLLIDNILWDVKVLEPEKDRDGREMHAFNTMVSADSRVRQLLLPIRDGLMILKKDR